MDDWQPFHFKLVLLGTNTTQQNIMYTFPNGDWLHRITNVALENLTSATTFARLRVFDGVIEHFHREWRTLSADVLYYDNTLDLPLGVGENVGVAFFGITANDELIVYLRGYRKQL